MKKIILFIYYIRYILTILIFFNSTKYIHREMLKAVTIITIISIFWEVTILKNKNKLNKDKEKIFLSILIFNAAAVILCLIKGIQ